MKETEIKEVATILGVAMSSPLRNLFYKKNGHPRQNVLYTNQGILNTLKVYDYEPNSLELKGIIQMLAISLARIRRDAKESGLAWVDVEIAAEGDSKSLRGKLVARHGFSTDIHKILLNADKFDELAIKTKLVAEVTRQIANGMEASILGVVEREVAQIELFTE